MKPQWEDRIMDVGDKVILQYALGPCKPNSKGIVKYIDKQGNMLVEITNNPEGTPVTFLLGPYPPNYFVLDPAL